MRRASTSPGDHPGVQEIFDAEGNSLGAILGPEAWAQVRDQLMAAAPIAPPAPEPLEDWRSLVEFWDFTYPVDLDVSCPLCGNASADWERDDPRKFLLTAANLGGLVAFRCLGCQAKVIKRHFHDEIQVEAKEYLPEKAVRDKGRGS